MLLRTKGYLMTISNLKQFMDKHPYVTFTIGFIVMLFVTLIPLQSRQGSLFNPGLFVFEDILDGLKQHVIFLERYVMLLKQFFANGFFPTYDAMLGLGADFVTSYTYYGLFDPLNIVAFVLPIQYIEISYFMIAFLRVYLSGIIMMHLVKSIYGRHVTYMLLGGFIYAFSTFILFNVYRHPFFVNGPLYLVLMVSGSERIYQGKNPIVLILAVFLSVISQFYFFVYTAFGFALYLIYKTILDEKKYSMFFKIAFYAFVGVLLGGVILITQLTGMIEGARLGSKGFTYYTLDQISSIAFSHIIPVFATRYTIGVGNLILFYILINHSVRKDKKRRWMSWYFLTGFSLMFLPHFGFLSSGFSYVNNRFSFILVLPMTLMVIDQVSAKRSSRIEINISNMIIGGYILLSSILGLSSLFLKENNLFFSVVSATTITCLIGIILYLMRQSIARFTEMLMNKYMIHMIYASILITGLMVSFYYVQNTTPSAAFSDYYYERNRYDQVLDQDSFYRVEQTIYGGNVEGFSNDGLVFGYRSTSVYNSMVNGSSLEYIKALNVINSNNSVGYNGFDLRSELLSLNHVKYVFLRESEQKKVPYGFELIATVDVEKYDPLKRVTSYHGNIVKVNDQIVTEKLYIYENMGFINFGYVTSSTFNESVFMEAHPLIKQKIMMSHVILEDGISDAILETNISKHTVDDYQVTSDNTSITFQVEPSFIGELYVELEGLVYNSNERKADFIIETSEHKTEGSYYKYGTNMYGDIDNQLVHLGYYNTETQLEVKIHFSDPNISFSKINYYVSNVDDLLNHSDQLNEHTLENLHFSNQGFTGDIELDSPGYLVINLPYSKGFKAYVNEEPTPISKANIGSMAIFLESGTHHIEFKYQTNNYLIGLWISMFGAINVIFIVSYPLWHKHIFKRMMNNPSL